MFVPKGMTEAEVMADIEHVVEFIAPKFVFGYFDVDDIKQEARIECVNLLAKEKFDENRQLRNYLYRHLQFRLINLHRNLQFRNEPPCKECAAGRTCGPEGSATCAKHASWLSRNQLKCNLMNPFHLGSTSEDGQGDSPFSRIEGDVVSPHEEAGDREVQRKLDLCLSVDLRGVFLRLRDGVPQPESARKRLKNEMKRILAAGVSRN